MRTYIGRRADLYSFVLRPILVASMTYIGQPADQYRFVYHPQREIFLSEAGCFCVVGLSSCVLWGSDFSSLGWIALH